MPCVTETFPQTQYTKGTITKVSTLAITKKSNMKLLQDIKELYIPNYSKIFDHSPLNGFTVFKKEKANDRILNYYSMLCTLKKKLV